MNRILDTLLTTAILLLAAGGVSAAAKDASFDLSLQGRGSFCAEPGGNGFKGEYLNLSVSGSIGEHFSVRMLHRIMEPIANPELLNATDLLYVTWENGPWSISAGKMPLTEGGYEYDAAPIDVYFFSDALGRFSECFQYGVSVQRRFGPETLRLGAFRSPFGGVPKALSGRYGYGVALSGTCEHFEHIYSSSFYETSAKGDFVAFQSFGNRIKFSPVTLDLDLYHRFSCNNPSFFGDFTITCLARVHAASWLDVVAKATYDYNDTGRTFLALTGIDKLQYGGGVEFFPMRNSRDVRIHVFYNNDNVARKSFLSVGLMTELRLLRSK